MLDRGGDQFEYRWLVLPRENLGPQKPWGGFRVIYFYYLDNLCGSQATCRSAYTFTMKSVCLCYLHLSAYAWHDARPLSRTRVCLGLGLRFLAHGFRLRCLVYVFRFRFWVLASRFYVLGFGSRLRSEILCNYRFRFSTFGF